MKLIGKACNLSKTSRLKHFYRCINGRRSRRDALINLTLANKYDLKCDKAIGVSFVANEDDTQDIEWLFVQDPWERNTDVDELLRENNPFRPVTEQSIDRYKFQ